MDEWRAYYILDPWGPERADLAAGIITAMIANVNRGKDSKPVSPADVMPKYGQIGDRMPEPEQMKQQLLATFGDKIKRRKRDGAS
jgi:Protein of unknown function (DUF4035)